MSFRGVFNVIFFPKWKNVTLQGVQFGIFQTGGDLLTCVSFPYVDVNDRGMGLTKGLAQKRVKGRKRKEKRVVEKNNLPF